MRIVFFSYGTRGDTQPQVAMAEGLKQRGFDVRVAAPENHQRFVEKAGLEFAPLFGNSQDILESEEGQRWLRTGNVNAFMKEVTNISAKIDAQVFANGLQATDGADLIVGGTLAEEMSNTLAEYRKVPLVYGHTMPVEATGAHPAPFVTSKPLPLGVLNRATWALYRMAAKPVHGKSLAAFRARLGLPPRDSGYGLAADFNVPVLQLWSPHVLAHPHDAGPLTQTTGYVKLQASVRQRLGEATPAPELVKWLGEGPAPVYVGFGSMPMPTLEQFAQELAGIGRELKVRFVLCGGWNDASVAERFAGAELFILKAVDHSWLFPRCAAVVHHGGAGSTAASLDAGVPTVICSFFADQPFWGDRVKRLGVGTSFPAVRLTPQRLTAALREVLVPEVKARAAALGERLRAEDGTRTAVDTLERLAQGDRRAVSAQRRREEAGSAA
jgi:sterol 3beta-glucosyltransferase